MPTTLVLGLGNFSEDQIHRGIGAIAEAVHHDTAGR
ncbi:MAG: hypothetical protein JWM50_363 [Microbacteriaceae bacterium]|jgi:hypothetical protein|nr:hypothetical protein [Microbacteriaceae bacterium]